MIYHIYKLKNKNNIVISIDSDRVFDKIQQHFMVKTLSKIGKEGTTFYDTIKAIYQKSNNVP